MVSACSQGGINISRHFYENNSKKAIPLQALTGPEGSRRLRLPDFKTTDI
jgi:hypothetical protein